MKPHPLRRCASSLELLEARIAPAVIALRTGAAPNFSVTFSDDGSDDLGTNLAFRFNNATQNIEFTTDNGFTFSNNLGGGNTASYANITSINVRLSGGDNDRLTM